jgi:acylphosphatase
MADRGNAMTVARDGGGSSWTRLEVTIRGRVQGVGFRAWVVRQSRRLGLDGWVANRNDGGVEILAEGPRADLETLLEALREGPPSSWVERVEVRWMPGTGSFDGFVVRSWGHGGD